MLGLPSGRFLGVDPTDGSILFDFKARSGVNEPPAVSPDGTALFGSLDQNLYAVSTEGDLVQSVDIGGPVYSAPTLDVEGDMLVGTSGALVRVGLDGTVLATLPVTGRVESQLAGGSGTLYAATTSPAALLALDPGGEELWSLDLTGLSPTLGMTRSGLLLVSTLDSDARGTTLRAISTGEGGLAATYWPKIYRDGLNSNRAPVPHDPGDTTIPFP
jgi:outer membrane protein assembly factor BamB